MLLASAIEQWPVELRLNVQWRFKLTSTSLKVTLSSHNRFATAVRQQRSPLYYVVVFLHKLARKVTFSPIQFEIYVIEHKHTFLKLVQT